MFYHTMIQCNVLCAVFVGIKIKAYACYAGGYMAQ